MFEVLRGSVVTRRTSKQHSIVPEIYGSGQKTGKVYVLCVTSTVCQKYTVQVRQPEQCISGYLARAVYVGKLVCQKYTVQVRKPENYISRCLT